VIFPVGLQQLHFFIVFGELHLVRFRNLINLDLEALVRRTPPPSAGMMSFNSVEALLALFGRSSIG
jgi:hypothetical protein